jgi:hypothetical protein
LTGASAENRKVPPMLRSQKSRSDSVAEEIGAQEEEDAAEFYALMNQTGQQLLTIANFCPTRIPKASNLAGTN